MIELLANIQPIVLIVLLIVMYSIENLFPYLNRPVNRKRHYRRNFTVSLISFIMNAGLGILVVMILEWTAKNNWGLLNHVNIPATAKVILGILLFDFGSYLTHNLQHKVPFLWRFHRIHHSAHQQLTDSHYGDVFTFWDRIFGTWGHTQPHELYQK